MDHTKIIVCVRKLSYVTVGLRILKGDSSPGEKEGECKQSIDWSNGADDVGGQLEHGSYEEDATLANVVEEMGVDYTGNEPTDEGGDVNDGDETRSNVVMGLEVWDKWACKCVHPLAIC